MDKETKTSTEQAAKAADKQHDAVDEPASESTPEKKPHHHGQPGEAACEKKHGAHAEISKNEVEQVFSELSERLLRLTAEFDNYKKRTAREKEELCRASEARLMLRLLPAYEEAGLAAKEVEKIPDAATRKGVLMVLGNLRKSFEGEGLQPMKLENEKLDPFRHEVAMREESSAPEGAIVRVIKQGYLYKGAVLQHAIVSVSSGKESGNGAETKNEPSSEVGE